MLNESTNVFPYDYMNKKKYSDPFYCNTMNTIGVHEIFVRLIRECVQGSKCKVKIGCGWSEDFEVVVGLIQRDV